MAEVDHGLLTDAAAYVKTELAQFGNLRTEVGLIPAVLIVLALVSVLAWWKWDELAKRPGVTQLLARLSRRRISHARSGSLTVAITHLEDDQNREYEKLLRDALDNDFDGAETIPIDRSVALTQDAATGREAIEKATEEARELLRRSRADVILWGKVVRLGSKGAMRLYWTTAHHLSDVKRTESYSTDSLALPTLFWDDLKQVLGMLTQSRLALLQQALTGHYFADKLLPVIGQVRRLLQVRQGSWAADAEAGVRFALADALQEYGSQGGSNDALCESIAAYRRVLTDWTRERVPLDWAMTQNNLGNALSTLGERESGTARARRRRRPPIATRSRNGPASACRSTGR